MRRYSFCIPVLFCILFYLNETNGQSSVVYSSPDPDMYPAANVKMLQMNLAKLYPINKTVDGMGTIDISNEFLKGGILANANGKRITLSVYAGKVAPDKLIYKCFSSENAVLSDGFTEHSESKIFNYGWGWHYNVQTTDMRMMGIQVARIADPGTGNVFRENNGIGYRLFDKIPVIIVVDAPSGSDVKSIKVPVIGTFDINEFSVIGTPTLEVNGNVSIAAHRGVWQGVNTPENTKASINAMMKEGYTMVELDLWLLNDNTVIVFHDEGLNKRTNESGNIKTRSYTDVKGMGVKNRFEEIIHTADNTTNIQSLAEILGYIKQGEITTGERILLNLDRSANDMDMFKRTYQVVKDSGMLNRAIFKGRFDPAADIITGFNAATNTIAPTAQSMTDAFAALYPTLTVDERKNKMRLLRFTPILFDNNLSDKFSNNNEFAAKLKKYIDDWIATGVIEGFELNFKSTAEAGDYSNALADNAFLLRKWQSLGNLNFVEYVHSKKLPVGIFASVPEVCAVPFYNANGTRNKDSLVSGFVKEDTDKKNADGTLKIPTYMPYIKEQATFDFRGDWGFYIPAGADFVITDRPDALKRYLHAIGRYKN